MEAQTRILVIGACGQLGLELTSALRARYGWQSVIAADIHPPTCAMQTEGTYIHLNVLKKSRINSVVKNMSVKIIYHLAATLSATGETHPLSAWELNMQGLLNVLEVARENRVARIFWPSSIAVFGPESLRAACTQHSQLDPVTVYGVSKQAGEYWCRYYCRRYGLDVRSIRYPGLISYKTKPGGGTTDYAIDIFYRALAGEHYTCFLKEDTGLPMLYMEDAVRGTVELMEAERSKLHVDTSYNLTAMHFTPRELAAMIRKHIPDFTISYAPDFRQEIAESWPSSIIDLEARKDWGWLPKYDLPMMVVDMLQHIGKEAYA